MEGHSMQHATCARVCSCKFLSLGCIQLIKQFLYRLVGVTEAFQKETKKVHVGVQILYSEAE